MHIAHMAQLGLETSGTWNSNGRPWTEFSIFFKKNQNYLLKFISFVSIIENTLSAENQILPPPPLSHHQNIHLVAPSTLLPGGGCSTSPTLATPLCGSLCSSQTSATFPPNRTDWPCTLQAVFLLWGGIWFLNIIWIRCRPEGAKCHLLARRRSVSSSGQKALSVIFWPEGAKCHLLARRR